MTSLTPYKVADAVGPDGQRLGGAVGLATYRATRGFIKRVACYIWEKKKEQGGFHFTFRSKFGLNGQHWGGSQIWAERCSGK